MRVINFPAIIIIVGTAAGLEMELTVCNSGLKVITKEQGLTEYRAHRITYNICPEQYPKLFVWVYKHEGKKLKVSSHSLFIVLLAGSQVPSMMSPVKFGILMTII